MYCIITKLTSHTQQEHANASLTHNFEGGKTRWIFKDFDALAKRFPTKGWLLAVGIRAVKFDTAFLCYCDDATG